MQKKLHKVEDFEYLINIILKRFNYSLNDYDELYQISLIAIYKAIKNYDENKSSIKNFIIRYIIYEAKNFFRNKIYEPILEVDDIVSKEVNDYSFLLYELNQMSLIKRKILILKFYKSMNQLSIAEKLNISQSSVSRLEKIALNELKERIISY